MAFDIIKLIYLLNEITDSGVVVVVVVVVYLF